MVTGHSYEVRSFVFCDLYDTVTRSVAGHLLVHVRSMGTLDSRHTGTHMGLVVTGRHSIDDPRRRGSDAWPD